MGSTFTREQLLEGVSDQLALLEYRLAHRAQRGLTDDLRGLEDFFAGLLNRVMRFNFVNANWTLANTPAIDLSDDEKRVAAQVTASTSLRKIRATLMRFRDHGLVGRYDRLLLLYPQARRVRRRVTELVESPPTLDFRLGRDELTFGDVVDKCASLELENLEELLTWLRQQISRIESNEEDSTQAEHGRVATIRNTVREKDPLFVGREEILERIHRNFSSDTTRIQAIHGMAGMGKTLSALEYALRHATEYRVIWWVRAADASTRMCDLSDLGLSLGLYQSDAKNTEEMIRLTLKWLETNNGWLLILDDLPAVCDLPSTLACRPAGHTIVTSRSPVWSGLATPVCLAPFSDDESLEYLGKRLGSQLLRLCSATTAEQATSKWLTLAHDLGGLPAALASATAYIDSTQVSLEDYLTLNNERHNALWADHDAPHGCEHTHYAAISMSIDAVQRECLESEQLLTLASFLSSDEVPVALLRTEVDLPDHLALGLSDMLKLNRIVAVLRRYALIERTSNGIAIHSLVQRVGRDRAEALGQDCLWAERAVRLVCSALPQGVADNYLTWDVYSQLKHHALIAAYHGARLAVAPEETAQVFNQLASYEATLANFKLAVRYMRSALEVLDSQLPGPSLQHANYLGNMAAFQVLLEDRDEAERLLHRAIEMHERCAELDLRLLSVWLRNLAACIESHRTRWNEVEVLYHKSLALLECADDPSDVDRAICLGAFGRFLMRSGKLSEAELLIRRSLRLTECQHGRSHHRVAIRLSDLAQVLQSRAETDCNLDLEGQLQLLREAEQLTRRALGIDIRVRGKYHPEIAIRLNNLGQILKEIAARLDDHEARASARKKAKKLLERALFVTQRCSSSKSVPDTIRANLEQLDSR